MIGEGFQLYDTLNCLAESLLGEPSRAEHAWFEAAFSAYGLYPAGSDPDVALHRLITAAQPPRTGPERAWLWNALNAASLAVLPAMAGNREETAEALADAGRAVSMLPGGPEGYALAVILGEIRATAEQAGAVS